MVEHERTLVAGLIGDDDGKSRFGRMILMPSTAVWYPGWETSLSLEAATFTETESGASAAP